MDIENLSAICHREYIAAERLKLEQRQNSISPLP